MTQTELVISQDSASILEVRRINLDDPRYVSFLKHIQATYFFYPDWLKMIARANRLEPVCYAGLDQEGICQVLAGYLFDWKLGKIFFASLFEGGFAGSPESFEKFMEWLMPELRKDRITTVRITKSFFAVMPDPKGFRKKSASQHILDLKDLTEEKLWNDIYRNRVRKAIRKVRREGVQIDPIDSMDKMDQLGRLNEATIKRGRSFSSFDRSTLEGLYQECIQKGHGRGWLVRKGDVYIAGLLNVYSDHASHGLIGGSLQEYLQLPANDLLIHEAILDAIHSGRRYFDFMCSFDDYLSHKSFKAKFGAVEYSAAHYEKDLMAVRGGLWRFLWWGLHTSIGGRAAHFIRSIRSRK